MSHKSSQPGNLKSLRRRCVIVLKWVTRIFLTAVAIYLAIVAVGLVPVNTDFRQPESGVEIHLVSSSVHAEIILPIESSAINWRDKFPSTFFSGDTSNATYVSIGWGDRSFFVSTPTWDEIRVSTAANALLWPSDTCLHVTLSRLDPLTEGMRSVRISNGQYRKMIDYVNQGFRSNEDGALIQIDGVAWGHDDAFFEAHGNYHCLNTCNSWVGGAMRSAEIKTAWLTPLPKTMFLYLED